MREKEGMTRTVRKAGRDPSRLVLVSDLDSTLLHEETYDFDEARPLLRFLGERGIALVLVSSKTRKEMEAAQAELDVHGPFICENGGAVVIPPGFFSGPAPGAVVIDGKEVLELGRPVRVLQRKVGRLATEAGLTVRTILEMEVDEVAALTGLPKDKAALARDREYILPFQHNGPDAAMEAFRRKAEREGLRVVRGGRFYHLMGDVDKGRAFSRLRAIIESSGDSRFVVALGDAENDLGLLRGADQAVVIPRRAGWEWKLMEAPGVRPASRRAPGGWTDEVWAVLNEFGIGVVDSPE
jgi:mannosyl-3-phosphoglycerate phosphatase